MAQAYISANALILLQINAQKNIAIYFCTYPKLLRTTQGYFYWHTENENPDLFNSVSKQKNLTLLIANLNALNFLKWCYLITLTVLETRIINSRNSNGSRFRLNGLSWLLSYSYCSSLDYRALAASKIHLPLDPLCRFRVLQKHFVVQQIKDSDIIYFDFSIKLCASVLTRFNKY